MTKIAVSMIMQDEEEYIGRAVSSVTFADCVCIYDFVSQDDSVWVAKKSTPKGVLLYLDQGEWPDDFSAARNLSLGLVPTDRVDWWMRLDADEEYSPDLQANIVDMLEGLPDDITAVRIRQTNLWPDKDHYVANLGGFETHPRIFRVPRDGSYQLWSGQVHEFVKVMGLNGLVPIPQSQIATWGAQVFHYGWLEKSRREQREDLYTTMPGSGVKGRGDLTDRKYAVRELPPGVRDR